MRDKRRSFSAEFQKCMQSLTACSLSPFDLLPYVDVCEKCIDLVVNGEPSALSPDIAAQFYWLRRYLQESDVRDVRVVVFGGGSGLSNVIGGDSRLEGWGKNPFVGLKEFFPHTRSIVCITDDGGSTGELLKDLPLIALGDIRHVLLSSITHRSLMRRYELTLGEGLRLSEALAEFFNNRYQKHSISSQVLSENLRAFQHIFPQELYSIFSGYLHILFDDKRLAATLQRKHCLGNLLLVAAIFRNIDSSFSLEELEQMPQVVASATKKGIEDMAATLAVAKDAVIPCTMTPAQLRFCYSNGVESTGEYKSSISKRGYAVDHVVVDFSDTIELPLGIIEAIEEADILLMAPGSLYSSIIPILQVPELADAVRRNTDALKMLIANIWVQAGETDIAISEPERKFHISDMIRAYERNIPGGIRDLFDQVLCLSMKDIPGSVLQNYALEGKMPIYTDGDIVKSQGFQPLECSIYSKKAMAERGVIQHDPYCVAAAVKAVYLATDFCKRQKILDTNLCAGIRNFKLDRRKTLYPSRKFRLLEEWVKKLQILFPDRQDVPTSSEIRDHLVDIIWKHQDIPLGHLNYFMSVEFIDVSHWQREQRWDRVFSFYDPDDRSLKIRYDQLADIWDFEVAFLIALGQSLLGNYALEKSMSPIIVEEYTVGKIYNLTIRDDQSYVGYFSLEHIDQYLQLARMIPHFQKRSLYIRIINGEEGFTPPGVLMGLCYAWYLDNRLASHIEYKMALMKISESNLIPEQLKMKNRRISIIDFFRNVVFKYHPVDAPGAHLE